MPTTVRSFSKINLGLAIGPARANGYHGLTTCYQTLEAHDLVTVAARPAAETAIRISSDDDRVPADSRNTAWKSVELGLQAWGIGAEVAIHIEKRLPVQGGMGAGSANAAAALLALERELIHHGIAELSGPEKLRIAAAVGSDVPLFLIGGAVLGLGHGEEVYPLPDIAPRECVIALPEVGVSTPLAFRDWDAQQAVLAHEGAGIPGDAGLTAPKPSDKLLQLSRALASAFCRGGTHSSGVFALSEDLAEKTRTRNSGVLPGDPLLALVRTGMENDFEEVVFRQHPFLGEIKRILAGTADPAEAAVCAALSGSGSALFGLYSGPEAAAAAQVRLSAAGVRWMRTRTLPREDYWATMAAGNQPQSGRL